MTDTPSVLDEDYDEPWFPEEPGQVERAFCDVYDPHTPHVYVARNGWVIKCPGITQDDLDAMTLTGSCEHGLSAMLCAGPGHYPMDGDR